MKYLPVIFICAFFIKGWSQVESNFLFQTRSGYEYNIFRFPDRYLDPELDEVLGPEDLYTNSLFQQGSFRMLFSKKWRGQEINLRVNPVGRFYLDERESSYYTLYNRFRYINRFTKKTIFTATVRYNYRNREGQNLDESAFRTPLGFAHFEAVTGLDFRLYKSNRTKLELLYANRNYQNTEQNDLVYDLLGANLIFRNVFKTRAGYHSYGIRANFNNRKYLRTDLEDNENNLRRNWNFTTLQGFYRYPVSEVLTLEPAMAWNTRTDLDNGRFTYSQLEPSLRLRYRDEIFTAEAQASYAIRNFEQLRATDSDNNDLGLLQFNYTRINLDVTHKLSDNLSIAFDLNVNIRESNRTNVERVLFRGFDYYYTGIGLQWTF